MGDYENFDRKRLVGVVSFLYVIFIGLLITLFVLSGCEPVQANDHNDDQFVVQKIYGSAFKTEPWVHLVTDVDTGVQYIVVTENGIAITPRLDGTGTMSSYLKLRGGE